MTDLVDDRLDYRLRRFSLELLSAPKPVDPAVASGADEGVEADAGASSAGLPLPDQTTVLLQDSGQSVTRVMEKYARAGPRTHHFPSRLPDQVGVVDVRTGMRLL